MSGLRHLLRTAGQWRTAVTPTSVLALVGAAGTAVVVALVLTASGAGVPQDVTLPHWFGAWPTGAAYRPALGAAVIAVIAAWCLVWIHLAHTWLRPGAPVPRLRSIALVAIAWAVPLTLAGPIGSLDVQSYAAVGRLALLGIDPYHFGPGVAPGAFAAAVSGEWLWTPTPYGPWQVSLLQQLAALAGDHLGLAVLLIRAVAVLGLAAAAVLAAHAAPAAERAGVLLLVALNPLVLIHVVSGAHLDVLVGALAVAVVLLVRRGHPVAAMVAAVIAGLLKMPGLLLVGYVGLDVLRRTDHELRRLRGCQVLGAGAATVVATMALVPDAFGWLGALSVPGTVHSGLAPSTWVSWAIAGVTGMTSPQGMVTATTIGRTVTAAAGALVALRLLWHATQGPERSAYFGVGWGLIALAFACPTTYPWYLTWGLFLAAVGGAARGRFALLALCAAYALLGGWSGGVIGAVAMIAAFLAVGATLWHDRRRHAGDEPPVPARAAVSS
ncbi:MAG: polyprenol phosphomannose-dependent alpha 1,6 mannosyltransferase MptB [Micrococcales bacterium]|nr:polyprenol phosphomannose-dependent alpha 1,6 mannosyltransferase MptB [Micrococcales bacterium]